MTFVHETRQPDVAADLVVRIGAALPYIAGVTAAEPPYTAPPGATIGHGVAVETSDATVQVTCFVVLDTRLGITAPQHAADIVAVVEAVVNRASHRSCTVSVVVCDVRTEGTHV